MAWSSGAQAVHSEHSPSRELLGGPPDSPRLKVDPSPSGELDSHVTCHPVPKLRRARWLGLLAIAFGVLPILGGCAALESPHELRTGLLVPPLARMPAEAPDTLRVVTWNIRYGIELDRALEAIRTHPELADADFYCFQELGPQDVRYMAHELGLGGAYFAASRKEGADRTLGNAVLGRWPVDRMRRIALPFGGRWQESTRAATVVEFVVGTRHLRVVSTHTATPLLSPEGRVLQARSVARAAIEPPLGAVIVAGDFNTVEPGDETALHGLFRDAGFLVASAGSAATIDTRWKRWGSPNDRLDHVFARGFEVLASGVFADTQASDHRPVWTLLRWVPDLHGASRPSARGQVDESQ